MCCTYPEKDLTELNELIHKILGCGCISVLGKNFTGEDFFDLEINRDKSLEMIKLLTNNDYLNLYKIINFYYSRWIAYSLIKEGNDTNSEFSSNNQLLLALTSIIDYLANKNKEKHGWTKRFVSFLERNLEKSEINSVINQAKIYRGSKPDKLKDLNDFANYIYEVRSLVVHNAELGGIYPHNLNLEFLNNGLVEAQLMIQPDIFRRLLWKAILKDFKLYIIK